MNLMKSRTMRRIELVFVCVLMAAAAFTCGCAGRNESTSSATISETALVELRSAPFLNVGRVPYGGQAGRTIEVVNVSDDPVEIAVAGRSCGCIEYEVPDEPIAPGATATIRFGLVVNGETKPVTHGVTIRAASTSNPERVQILQAGFSYAPETEFEVLPTQMSIEAVAGEAFTRSIYVHPRVKSDLQVLDARTSCAELSIIDRGTIERSGALYVTFSGLYDHGGREREYVELQTNSERFGQMRIPLYIHVHDRVVATPSSAVFLWPAQDVVEIPIHVTGQFTAADIRIEHDIPAAMQLKILPVDGAIDIVATLDTRALDTSTGSGMITVRENEMIVCSIPVAWALDTRQDH